MTLYKSENWEVVFLDWCQEFVGQCMVLSSKESLSDLSDDEWVELGKIEKELERVSKKCFDATMFNFSCLMNNAYLDDKKPFVHFHFMPRYKNILKILNKEYKDRHFGFNFWKWANSKFKRQKDIFTQEERMKIFEMMQKEWNLK